MGQPPRRTEHHQNAVVESPRAEIAVFVGFSVVLSHSLPRLVDVDSAKAKAALGVVVVGSGVSLQMGM